MLCYKKQSYKGICRKTICSWWLLGYVPWQLSVLSVLVKYSVKGVPKLLKRDELTQLWMMSLKIFNLHVYSNLECFFLNKLLQIAAHLFTHVYVTFLFCYLTGINWKGSLEFWRSLRTWLRQHLVLQMLLQGHWL